jgi:hypothetical protein
MFAVVVWLLPSGANVTGWGSVGLLQPINGANKIEGKRSHIRIRHIVLVVGCGALQAMRGLLLTQLLR